MVKTSSSMPALGTPAPNFQLTDTINDETVSLAEGAKGYLVMFICNHCPYVVHIRQQLVKLAAGWQEKDIAIYAISANDPEQYPEDHPTAMKQLGKYESFSFPYLFDADQEVAKAYAAACTPDFFLYDQGKKLFYRGQLDSSRPGNDKPVDGHDLNAAIESLLAGEAPPQNQVPSIGCNIKWKN